MQTTTMAKSRKVKCTNLLIIEENKIDVFIQSNIFKNCGFEGNIIDVPTIEYAIAHFERCFKDQEQVPDVVWQQIDFRTSDDFETMFPYLTGRKMLESVRHFGLSCTDDKRFFRDTLALSDTIQIVTKPLYEDHLRDLYII